MAIENLYATNVLVAGWANASNALFNVPTTWAGVANTNSTETGRWAIGNPVDPLTAGATQTIHILARKGTNTGNPSITINLWENGVLVREIGAGILITNTTTGQSIDATFLTSEITNRANVEIEVIGVFVGGSGNARNSPQIAYINWEAVTTPGSSPATISGVGSTSPTRSDIAVITVSNPPVSISGVGSTSVVTSAVGGITVSTPPVTISGVGSTSVVTSGVGGITASTPPASISGVGSTSVVTSAVGGITVSTPPVTISGVGSTSVVTSGVGGITVSNPPVSISGVGSTSVVTSAVGQITTPVVSISGVGSTSVVTSAVAGVVVPGTPNAISDLSGVAGIAGEVVLSWSEPVGVQ